MDTMFVSFPIQQSTNCKFCLNEVTQKENKEQKHAHNRHISDKYSTKQEIEIRRLKNEGGGGESKQIMVQSGSFTTEVGLILKAQFRRSAVQ